MRTRRDRAALLADVACAITPAAVPHGFTIVMWSSGALVLANHRDPSVPTLLLFAVGGLAAFAMLSALTGADGSAAGRRREYECWLPAVAAAVAICVATGVAQLPAGLAWPFTSAASTISYFLVLAWVSRARSPLNRRE